MIAAPQKAATPPVMWTTPEPAKSMQPPRTTSSSTWVNVESQPPVAQTLRARRVRQQAGEVECVPVNNNRVDPSSDHNGVDQVGRELSALSNGARNDGSGRSSKAILEPPQSKVVASWVLIFTRPPSREK
eukprot:6213820-Pleurochrysis_carterae.AAC.3